jgi:hypothetical protein
MARQGMPIMMAARRVVAVRAVTMSVSSTSSGLSRRSSRYRGRCFDCGERGHMIRNCLRKKKERALLCDFDD